MISDGVVQLQGTSLSDDDKDFFRFTMPADGDISFEVNSTNGNFAQLQLEDRLGNDIIETEPNDGINSGSVTLRGGDTFYVRLRSKTDGPAEYQVNIGMSAATSTPISAGDFMKGESEVDETSNDDSGRELNDDKVTPAAAESNSTVAHGSSSYSFAGSLRLDGVQQCRATDLVFAGLEDRDDRFDTL